MDIFASGNDIPERFLYQSVFFASYTVIGTSEALGSTTVCPSFLVHIKPSPVDPVSGRDFPPVAKIIFYQIYLVLFFFSYSNSRNYLFISSRELVFCDYNAGNFSVREYRYNHF